MHLEKKLAGCAYEVEIPASMMDLAPRRKKSKCCILSSKKDKKMV